MESTLDVRDKSDQIVKHRHDIQGLRGLAVLAVVLFHMWSRTFPNGYMGVDVFFVISGFLMSSILERQQLTKSSISVFYFRRLRRILPLYLCMILIVLAVSTFLIHPFEYAQLIGETFPSIFFFANHPAVHSQSYFDLHKNVFFFTHAWSLCVELEFYLVVPLVVGLLRFLHQIHPSFGYLCLVYLQVLSFWRQYFGYVDVNNRHMMPDARLWQFLTGFLAFRLQTTVANLQKRSFCLTGTRTNLINLVATCVLVVLLFCSIDIKDTQILRLLVTTTTLLLLSMPLDSQCSLLNWSPLVCLGDFSYSLYLFHWPIFVYHRYLNPHAYDMDLVWNGQAGWGLGLPPFLLAFLIGYAFEEMFKFLGRHLRSWLSFLFTVGLLYFCIGAFIVYLGQNIRWPFDNTIASTPEWAQNFEQNIQNIWKQRSNISFTRQESLQLNREMTKYNMAALPCHQNTTAPTDYPFLYLNNTYVCRDKGGGQKNIVVIGNSHALYSHTGIRHHFHDIYANITLFAATACMLAPAEQQIPIIINQCRLYIKQLLPALRQWKHKIHVIMVFFGFARYPDRPINGPMHKDKLFNFMQDFYTNLSVIAQDLVFLTDMNLYFMEDHARIVQTKLHQGQELGKIGTTVDVNTFTIT